uniref:Uncharacterized protein n=1 Tax=Candidatus Methanophagaceae archaeon ANME-1 ERB6 TaxID=2759912 RepID=A0A7G9YTX0_9EURY|nr:hypothetical protein OGFGKJAA_00020 [Methanosarcinales archaeon ANME-1 ERB6]
MLKEKERMFLVKVFTKPLQGLRGGGVEPHKGKKVVGKAFLQALTGLAGSWGGAPHKKKFLVKSRGFFIATMRFLLAYLLVPTFLSRH